MSYLVYECRTSLNEMAKHLNIELSWLRGHGTCNGSMITDKLARDGANLNAEYTDQFYVEESTLHILCQCPATEESHLQYIFQLYFDVLSEINNMEISILSSAL